MIHFIIGTRAQLIKTAPVMAECKSRNIQYNFVFFAQHRQTIYEIIDLFGIKRPDLVIGDEGRDIDNVKSLLDWAVKVSATGLKKRRNIFCHDSKGIVLVHGDALPALMGAFLAKAAGLQVGHIEAGLRSFNFKHPFPEELTRVLLWKLGLTDYYFCPNDWALQNVAGYGGKKFNTGCNTLYDSLRMASDFKFDDGQMLVPKEKYAIVTLHRFETISSRQKLEEVLEIIDRITRQIRLLFILHPPTLVALKQSGLYRILEQNTGVELRPRYDYFRFIKLLQKSEFVITDGGSNQEECFYLGHPCLLLRYKTERTEGLGQNVVLSKFEPETIRHFVRNYESFRRERPQMKIRPSEMIVTALKEYW
ncbi:MAG: UDP-N-acetylglucosamine 2-epimerase [Syntrophobacteraceae bacterium]